MSVDLGTLGTNSGKVVVAPAELNNAMHLDGSIATSGTARTITVRLYVLDSPQGPAAVGCAPTSGAAATYLCDPNARYLYPEASVTLAPGKTQTFSWSVGALGPQAWLGAQLVGTASSTATIDFTGMTGTIYGR